jgi:hypothetical protein
MGFWSICGRSAWSADVRCCWCTGIRCCWFAVGWRSQSIDRRSWYFGRYRRSFAVRCLIAEGANVRCTVSLAYVRIVRLVLTIMCGHSGGFWQWSLKVSLLLIRMLLAFCPDRLAGCLVLYCLPSTTSPGLNVIVAHERRSIARDGRAHCEAVACC